MSGITRTGCGRKVTKVLDKVNGVSSVKAYICDRVAEFDLNSIIVTLPQVIFRIEKETGYKFSQIASHYQTLDVSINPAVAKSICDQLREITESVEKPDNGTWRINYNPTVTGARTLLSSIEGASPAPARNGSSLVNDRRRLITMVRNTGVAAMLTIPAVVLAGSKTLSYTQLALSSHWY